MAPALPMMKRVEGKPQTLSVPEEARTLKLDEDVLKRTKEAYDKGAVPAV